MGISNLVGKAINATQNPYGSFGNSFDYREKPDNGEDASYWSKEDQDYFRSLGFNDITSRGLISGSGLSDSQTNLARATGLIEGYGKNAPVRINGKEYARLGNDPLYGYGGGNFSGMAQNAANILKQSGLIQYDPTYGYIAPYEEYNKIAKATMGTSTNFGDFLVPAAMVGFGGLAAGLGSGGAGYSTLAGVGSEAPLQLAQAAGTMSDAPPIAAGSMGGEFSLSNVNPSMGLGGQTTTGLGLQAPAMAGVGTAAAPGIGSTSLSATGTTGSMLGTGATGYGLSGTAATAGAGSGGGGFWSTIFGSASPNANVAGGMAAGGLLQAVTNLWAAGKYEDAAKLSAQLSDPAASQRPFFQDLTKQSYTDPNFFLTNPVFQGLQKNALNQTNDLMSSQGYNMSGNQLTALNNVGINEGFKYALPFQAQLAQNAGFGISPGYAGYLSQQGSNMATNAKVGAAGAAATGAKGAIDLMNLGGYLD